MVKKSSSYSNAMNPEDSADITNEFAGPPWRGERTLKFASTTSGKWREMATHMIVEPFGNDVADDVYRYH
jgi:hypothetical protein